MSPGDVPSGAAVKRALSWVGIGHVVGQTFWFGSLLILAVILPPAAFGAVAIGLLLVTAANRTMESGTRGSIIIAKSLTRLDIRNTVAFNILVGLGLAVAIALLAKPISHFFASGSNALVLVALGIGVALYAPAIAPLALLEKNLQYKRRAGIQMAATTTASVVAVLAALAGAGVWSLVIRQLLFQVMLAVGGWIVAVRAGVIPRPAAGASGSWRLPRRAGAAAFMVFSLTDFAVFNADSLTVGHYAGTQQLGLYALAFTLAFAPVTQFSAQIGNVLFSASAASDPETIRRRTVSGVRLTSLVLLPVLPAAIVLSPVLVPALLGEKWAGMVPVFQLLLVVGVAHAIMNVIGESLSGTGNIDYRARVNAFWMVAMVVALVVLVQLDGIRGAGEAHLFLYLPVIAAYVIGGMRMIGASWRDLAGPLRPVLTALVVQSLATLVVWYLLKDQASETVTAAVAAASGGLACVAYFLTGGKEALRQARSALGRPRGRSAANLPAS
jgi:O-antigen/teichoic acid export membrane protein